MKKAAYNLAPWLSAALDDPKVCQEYKDAINDWFDTAMPAPAAPVQEPVAWIYDFLNPDNRGEVIRDWMTQDYSEIEREKGFNVRPLYAAGEEHIKCY
ncbi:UNVERIFIED_CONTAM: hypothetical protein [Bacteriophage sp.]